jgi:glutamyl-tRNA reductase
MALLLLGTDYKDVSLTDLNELENSVEDIYEKLTNDLAVEAGINASVVLSTCNRFEIYLDSSKFHSAIEYVISQLSQVIKKENIELKNILKISYDNAVISHLFSVASGLKSMVIGESEISGQVKRALEAARNKRATNKQIESLFQYCSRVSKQVATETGIGTTGKNMISVALDIYKKNEPSVDGAKVLVIGTGSYAKVVVGDLQKNYKMKILNYSPSNRAKEFSSIFDIEPVTEAQLLEKISEVDLIISCSGSNVPIITKDLLLKSKNSKLAIIDLSLNTDIADDVKELENIKIIDIEQINHHAPKEHIRELSAAGEIILFHVNKFQEIDETRKLDSVVGAMHNHINNLINQEVENVRKKSGPEIAVEVEKSLYRLAHSMLHTPSVKAKEVSKEGSEEDYRQAVKILFGIDESKNIR